jgi:hypothetical protein
MDLPLHPDDQDRIEKQEHEDLLNDQSKYIKKLLKQNFSKFRSKHKAGEKPMEAGLDRGAHTKSKSVLSGDARPGSQLAGFDGVSTIAGNLSMLSPEEADVIKSLSRPASK